MILVRRTKDVDHSTIPTVLHRTTSIYTNLHLRWAEGTHTFRTVSRHCPESASVEVAPCQVKAAKGDSKSTSSLTALHLQERQSWADSSPACTRPSTRYATLHYKKFNFNQRSKTFETTLRSHHGSLLPSRAASPPRQRSNRLQRSPPKPIQAPTYPNRKSEST